MTDSVVITGFHAVMSALEQAPKRVLEVYVEGGSSRDGKKRTEVGNLAAQLGVTVEERSNRFFRDRGKGRNTQGIAAKLREFGYASLEDVCDKQSTQSIVLLCDGVTDPQNLGAIVRSAAFFGAEAVVIPRDRSAEMTPLAERISSGGAAAVPIVRVTNIARAIEQLRDSGYWIYGTVEEGGDELSRSNLTGKTVIVVGAEGTGMRRLTRDKCDVLLTLPSAGTVPALNVSVFAGLMLYEAWRQQSAVKKG